MALNDVLFTQHPSTLAPRTPLRGLAPWVASSKQIALMLVLMAAVAVIFSTQDGSVGRQLGWWLCGGALGFTLYYTVFGFAGSWRKFIVQRDGSGLQAQWLLLAVATLLFYPALEQGELFGQTVNGIVRPVGVPLLAGAFIFGIGMQLASACSSGTLVTLGAGRWQSLLSLAGIVAGATLASAHYEWWQERPIWFDFSLIREFGAVTAIAMNLSLLALLAVAVGWFSRRRSSPGTMTKLLLGAVIIAGLNFATLVLTGRPWVVADAFPLWGAQLSEAAGWQWDVVFWEYWASDSRQLMLEQTIWQHSTSVMNIAMIVGALIAVLVSKRPAKTPTAQTWWQYAGAALLASVGGVLLGYGAIVGLGCNIGAFIGGVVSGSIHGWLWFVAAFCGSVVGIGLRSLVGLKNR